MLKAPGIALLLATCVGLGACNNNEEALTKQLLEANDKVLACQKELAQAKNENGGLKRQLAQAIANEKVQLHDPEVIQLVASIRGTPEVANDSGGLDPQKASEIVLNGAKAMQACYERALKRNTGLQAKQGIGLVLGITVRPNGDVHGVNISPDVDKDMTACMRTAATRWKFPSFAGSAVTIEQKITLTPKT
jgi:hypothetical protein